METINFDGQTVSQNPNEAPKVPNTRNKKLIWAGIVMATLILSVAGWQYWRYTNSMYYQQMKAVKTLEKIAKESDKWGGKTPEETVKLFTEAVKKGDFELASKYGNPELIESKLEQLKTDGKINILINGLEKGELEENLGFGGNSFDLRTKESGEKYWILGLFRSEGGTWKIVEF